MNEESTGGDGLFIPRQSKRKKTVPQKVETTPAIQQDDGLSPQDDGDTDVVDDVTAGGAEDAVELAEDSPPVSVSAVSVAQVMGKKLGSVPARASGAGRRHRQQRQQRPLLPSRGRESDGDTDEEMYFHVNQDGVITWQGSSLHSTLESDLGLLSVYHMEQQQATEYSDQMQEEEVSPSQQNENTLDGDNSSGIAISNITCGQETTSSSTENGVETKNSKSAVASNRKSTGKKQGSSTSKRRRRNNNGPYECKVCHKLFAQSSSRNRHTKLHYGIYDYACEVCGRQFARREHLKTHANKCPGVAAGSPTAGKRDSPGAALPQPQNSAMSAPGTSFSLLRESFGDVIMIQ